jgi:hypothetical protein
MSTHTAEIPRLVAHPREHYLRQNEGRIRSLAGKECRHDPIVDLHLNAVHMAEDLLQIHVTAALGYRTMGNQPHRVEIHEGHAAAARQFLLYHLDKLAVILL